MISQNKQILQHLMNGGSITPLQALKQFGCFRLSGRIHNLREMGHRIETTMVTKNGKRMAQYWLA